MIICDCCYRPLGEGESQEFKLPESVTRHNPYGTQEHWCKPCVEDFIEKRNEVRQKYEKLARVEIVELANRYRSERRKDMSACGLSVKLPSPTS